MSRNNGLSPCAFASNIFIANPHNEIMAGLPTPLIFFFGCLLLLLLVRRYHSQRVTRELKAVEALPESKNPVYDTCKIIGGFLMSRDDYPRGPFYLFIGPYFDYTLALPPSTTDCVFALRRTPQGTQFLGYAALIIHLLGTAAGGAFIYATITNTLTVPCLQQRDIEELLNCISRQFRVDSGGYKDGLLQSKYLRHPIAQARTEDIFKEVEREITITTTGFGEINFELSVKGVTIEGAGTLGRFQVKITNE